MHVASSSALSDDVDWLIVVAPFVFYCPSSARSLLPEFTLLAFLIEDLFKLKHMSILVEC